jgi:hypothetical protein
VSRSRLERARGDGQDLVAVGGRQRALVQVEGRRGGGLGDREGRVGADQGRARGVGVAAAFVVPMTFAIIGSVFPAGAARNRAFGVWGGVTAGAATLGLVLGGVLVSEAGWRWIFLINLPLGIFVIGAALRVLPADGVMAGSGGENAFVRRKLGFGFARFDVGGAASVTAGACLLAYAVARTGSHGGGAGRELASPAVRLPVGNQLVSVLTMVVRGPARVPGGSCRYMTGNLDARDRDGVIRALASEPLDVLVIGGGITGAGAALDAASRGLRVGLVESRDLAAGTSSRSSKLIHGGLRYLEQGDFKLVKEALRERDLLVSRLAPHLVRPVPFLYPLYKKVVERPYVGAGLVLYDAMEGVRRPVPHHRHLTTRGALRHMPALRPDRLAGAMMYYDAQVDDARYTVTVARTARWCSPARRPPCCCLIARWQKAPSYRAIKQPCLPGGRPPVPPEGGTGLG